MKPDEIRHLLGGYATGTLTPEEQKTLFDAALQDQSLFEALAHEQALKEALEAPGVRRELMEALESAPSWRERARVWMRWQIPVAAAGVLAAAVTVTAIVRYSHPLPQPASNEISHLAVAKPPAMQSSGDRRADDVNMEPMFNQEKAILRPTPRTAAKKAAVPEAAAPASVQSEPGAAPPARAAAVLDSVPAPSKEESKALQTSLLAAEQGSQSGNSNLVRELFYGDPSQAAGRMATSVEGGVAGGAPGSIARTREKASAADHVSSDRVAAPTQSPALGIRYSGRNAQGSPPQLVVEANADAVLYIFRRGESGDWLPVTSGGMSLKSRTPATSPAIGVDGNAPPPRTLLVLSRTPLPELAQTGRTLTATLEKLRVQSDSSQILTQTGSGSTYVVMPQSRPGGIIVVPVTVP